MQTYGVQVYQNGIWKWIITENVFPMYFNGAVAARRFILNELKSQENARLMLWTFSDELTPQNSITLSMMKDNES